MEEDISSRPVVNPDSVSLESIVHELAGYASMCWEPRPVGVFDSESVLKAADEAIKKILALRIPAGMALAGLRRAMEEDEDFMWGWHCNIAVPIDDATHCGHRQSNLAAARLMSHLFGVDVTKNRCWKTLDDCWSGRINSDESQQEGGKA